MIRKLTELTEQVSRHKRGTEWDVADAKDSGAPAEVVELLVEISAAYARAHRLMQRAVERDLDLSLRPTPRAVGR